MPRFFIEVPHPSDVTECTRTVEIFLRTRSHFLTRAEWGCMDGEHKAWMIVEVDSKDEARGIIPPAYRSSARIVQLNSFSLDQVPAMRSKHKPS